MWGLPLHPAIVHVPVGLAVVLPLLTIPTLVAWWRGTLPRRVWAIIVALQICLVGSGWIADVTGDEAAEQVAKTVPHDAIEHHEDLATTLLITETVVLVLSGAALFLRKEKIARSVALVATIGSVVGLPLAFLTGHAGGLLVFQYGAAVTKIAPSTR